MKKTALILFLLIAWKGTSQEDTTVKIPVSTAKQIALDLVDLDRLRALQPVSELELQKYRELTETLSNQSQNKSVQIELLKRNNKSLELELQAEKKKKTPLIEKVIYGVGIFAVGFLAGSI